MFKNKKDEMNKKAPSGGKVMVYTNTQISKQLLEEGLIRELSRQIQNSRKLAGYTPEDKIDLYIEKIDGNLKSAVNKDTHNKYLKSRVKINQIYFCSPEKNLKSFDLKINDYSLRISI